MITTEERIANAGVVSKFMLILKTCQLLAILFERTKAERRF